MRLFSTRNGDASGRAQDAVGCLPAGVFALAAFVPHLSPDQSQGPVPSFASDESRT